MLTAIRIILLIASFLGYCAALRKKNIPMPFVPILVLTAAGSPLFLAGILNLLPQATLVLLSGGLLCTAYLRSFRTLSRHDWICFSVFAGIALFFAWRLHGTVPLHYDNFTHWLRIVRDTLSNDRFPNFQSNLIIFPSYPAGAAAFAYLICKVTGLQTDAAALFSQAIVIAAALCTMLAFAKPFRLSGVLVFALGCIYCIVANPVADEAMLKILPDFVDLSICEMLPDTLISILSIAALSIVVFYRKDLFRGAWLSLPVQIYLISVKNSGLFMILFNTALLIFYACQSASGEKASRRSRAWKLAAIHSGIPFLVFYLWNRHADLVFASGTTSKHSVSLYYYRGMLGGKGISGILEILRIFLKRFFSWSDSWLLLAICIALFAAVFLLQKKKDPQAARTTLLIFGGIVLTYVLFMIALALMYLASMDYEEAIRLACYDRYEKTITVYLVGAITIFLLSLLSGEDLPKSRSVIAVAAVVLILLPISQRIPKLFIRQNPYEGSTRQFMEQAKEAYSIPDGARCLIYVNADPETDVAYSGYLAQYVFWSDASRLLYAAECDPEMLETAAQEYDYFIPQQQDATVQQFLTQRGYPLGQAVYPLTH